MNCSISENRLCDKCAYCKVISNRTKNGYFRCASRDCKWIYVTKSNSIIKRHSGSQNVNEFANDFANVFAYEIEFAKFAVMFKNIVEFEDFCFRVEKLESFT